MLAERLQELIRLWTNDGSEEKACCAKELSSFLQSAMAEEVKEFRPGWIVKDRHGCWQFSKKPVFTGHWDHLHGSYLIERSPVDPWPDHPNGGPECCMEVK